MMIAPKRTPLYEQHVKLGGRIVEFAGWELPVQYSGVIPEHNAVRSAAGIFDVSHMGEIFVSGPESEAALNYLTCNDLASLYNGKAQYSAIINDRGGVVDDIIVYRIARDKYLLCVNASNTDKDFSWLTEHNKHKAHFVNRSAEYGQIALQGPKSKDIITRLNGASQAASLKPFHFIECEAFGSEVLIARTGYTGEDGFEIFVPWGNTAAVWEALIKVGGVVPAGLGARDSLRLEACYPLHGHELGDDISAIESGLGWIVKFEKGDFLGAPALLGHKNDGAPRALIGFYLDDSGIARHGDEVFSIDGQGIGAVTSGTKTPTVNKALGLALVGKAFSKVGCELLVAVRGKKLRCHVAQCPFYKRAMFTNAPCNLLEEQ